LSSVIDDYTNQTITWKAKNGHNLSGQPTFAADAAIQGRWEETRRLVRNVKGEEVVSEAMCVTSAAVKVGDHLVDVAGREWEILAVSVRSDLDGNELFREARV
jgi:hypothetical protein